MAWLGKRSDDRVPGLEAQVCELEAECAQLRRALDRVVLKYASYQDRWDAEEDARDRRLWRDARGWSEEDGNA